MARFFHKYSTQFFWALVILIMIAAMLICSGLKQTNKEIDHSETAKPNQTAVEVPTETLFEKLEAYTSMVHLDAAPNYEEFEVEEGTTEGESAPITEPSIDVTQPVESTAVPELNGLGIIEEENEKVVINRKDYSYLLDIPYKYTIPEFVYVDNSESDGLYHDPNWLPGLKVSEITADCLQLPEQYTEQDLIYLATMLCYECITIGNDEMAMYTGGAFMNRTIHPEWFPSGFYDNIVRPNQYNPMYVSDSGIAKARNLLSWDRAIRDALLCMNFLADMPDNVIYQANFPQGSAIWKEIHCDTGSFSSNTWYCYQ